MRNLVSTKPERVLIYLSEQDYFTFSGCLRSPKQSSYIPEIVERGYTFACDNDCFHSYNPDRIMKFLRKYRDYSSYCTFFNVPDVVLHPAGALLIGDAKATLERFYEWQPIVRKLGWKCAFTLQNGMHELKIPWDDMDALWIGSNDNYRYKTHFSFVRETIEEALSRGLWVHVGRVNTINKILFWKRLNVSSFDGTKYTHEPKQVKSHLPFHKTNMLNLELFNSREFERNNY